MPRKTKKSIRRMPQTSRKLAKIVNDSASVNRRASNLLPEIIQLEHDAQMLNEGIKSGHRFIPADEKLRVLVEIDQGIATVTSDEGVEVIVVDYDVGDPSEDFFTDVTDDHPAYVVRHQEKAIEDRFWSKLVGMLVEREMKEHPENFTG